MNEALILWAMTPDAPELPLTLAPAGGLQRHGDVRDPAGRPLLPPCAVRDVLGSSRPNELDPDSNQPWLDHQGILDLPLERDPDRITGGRNLHGDAATGQLGRSPVTERNPNSDCRDIEDPALSPPDGGQLVVKKTESSQVRGLTWYSSAGPHCAPIASVDASRVRNPLTRRAIDESGRQKILMFAVGIIRAWLAQLRHKSEEI